MDDDTPSLETVRGHLRRAVQVADELSRLARPDRSPEPDRPGTDAAGERDE